MKNTLRSALVTGAIATAMSFASSAMATPSTETSPTGGALPAGVTRVGGIVLDLSGTNGNRIVSQLAASSLFVGFNDFNPQPIGTQAGFTSAILASLGGSLTAASLRVSLYDGDSAAGDFDFNDNFFFVNGVSFGGFSSVLTTQTNSTGTIQIGAPAFGFGDNILSTGFFSLTDAGGLSSLFTSLGATNSAVYTLTDADAGDNYYDFTQGVDGGLIGTGQGPTVTPPVSGAVPEPATWAMMILGMGAVGFSMRSAKRRSEKKFDTKIKAITAGALA